MKYIMIAPHYLGTKMNMAIEMADEKRKIDFESPSPSLGPGGSLV